MSTLHRTQLLLESAQHAALTQIAEQEGRSVSHLVRGIIQQHLDERGKATKTLSSLQAMEKLTQIRTTIQKEHGIYHGDPLAEVRAEQEAERERIWRGEP